LIERLGDIHPALSDRAGQRLAVDPVWTFLVASQGTRGSVEGDQFAGFWIDQGKPRRQLRPLRRVRIGPRRVEHDDARPPGRRGKSVAEIGEAEPFDRHVGVAIDLGVDRHKIIVAVVLNPAASEVDEGLHIGAGRRGFLQKVAKGRTQGLTIEVAGTDDVKTCSLQSLGHKTGVVGGCRKRRVTIGRVPDDKSDSGVRCCLLSFGRPHGKSGRDENQNGEDRLYALRHSAPLDRRTTGSPIRSSQRIANVASCPNRVRAPRRHRAPNSPSRRCSGR
jgi:hypothetical protein